MFFLRRSHIRRLHLGLTAWLYIAAALAMGFTVPTLNKLFWPWLVSPIEKSQISTILSSIASGMITLTGIVFSLVFVIVQYGTSTYSPRITRLFARVPVLHHALGVFTGTFMYSLMALRMIGIEETGSVSAFTVWTAFAWLLASIAVLILLVHAFASLAITRVLTALGRVGRDSIERMYKPLSSKKLFDRQDERVSSNMSADANRFSDVREIVYCGPPAYLVEIDTAALAALARSTDASIHLPYAIGDAIMTGEIIAVVQGTHPAVPEKRFFDAIAFGAERKFRNDPKYVLRMLVDTAIRALSPAINDPTTAVQALDVIEALLRRIGNAHLEIGVLRDSTGTARVTFLTPSWEDYLELAICEIMLYGAGSPQVGRRLEALFRSLPTAVPEPRRTAVARMAEGRRELVRQSFANDFFRRLANIPDREGIGAAARYDEGSHA